MSLNPNMMPNYERNNEDLVDKIVNEKTASPAPDKPEQETDPEEVLSIISRAKRNTLKSGQLHGRRPSDDEADNEQEEEAKAEAFEEPEEAQVGPEENEESAEIYEDEYPKEMIEESAGKETNQDISGQTADEAQTDEEPEEDFSDDGHFIDAPDGPLEPEKEPENESVTSEDETTEAQKTESEKAVKTIHMRRPVSLKSRAQKASAPKETEPPSQSITQSNAQFFYRLYSMKEDVLCRKYYGEEACNQNCPLVKDDGACSFLNLTGEDDVLKIARAIEDWEKMQKNNLSALKEFFGDDFKLEYLSAEGKEWAKRIYKKQVLDR